MGVSLFGPGRVAGTDRPALSAAGIRFPDDVIISLFARRSKLEMMRIRCFQALRPFRLGAKQVEMYRAGLVLPQQFRAGRRLDRRFGLNIKHSAVSKCLQ